MTDLLRPDEVRGMVKELHGFAYTDHVAENLARLCRDYLTLWDELEHEREISDKAVKRVRELEQEIGALMR